MEIRYFAPNKCNRTACDNNCSPCLHRENGELYCVNCATLINYTCPEIQPPLFSDIPLYHCLADTNLDVIIEDCTYVYEGAFREGFEAALKGHSYQSNKYGECHEEEQDQWGDGHTMFFDEAFRAMISVRFLGGKPDEHILL